MKYLGGLAFGLVLMGCGELGGGSGSARVGGVLGGTERVGLIISEQSFVFYVTGDAEHYETHTAWFSGPLGRVGSAQRKLEVPLTEEGFRISGYVTARRANGSITFPDGRTGAWTAGEAAGSMAGLYEAYDGECRTGAVVLQASESARPELQGTWCDGEGETAPLSFAQGLQFDPGSVIAQVEGIGESRYVYLTPVEEPGL